ncbi:PTDSS1_1 [Blepharisma stoltei]|uniref:Phosphatidylserine synthase n=1 Tax=Blepharisma stoltei TaxID=1481888 RepID=A0AAU9IM91_9CILI|nr:unnamed protein product [Blepharisma stoltei]
MEYGSQVLFFLTISYILCGLFWTSTSTEWNVKAGLIGVCLVFLAQSSLKPYKSPFIRVRDVYCRVGARFGLLYIGLLVFLLFQTEDDARALFAYIDPNLNKQLEMRTENYDRNCEFTIQNVYKLSDFYLLAHFLNWFFAALILRDYYILHIWSVLDELIELSLKNIRPNFAECWWDSLILDVLLANTLGIWIGMLLIRYFKSLEYDWFGRRGAKSIKEWKVWTEHRHFQGVFLVILFVSLNFVTGFTVSNSLWIPPSSKLNIVRLLIWLVVGGLGFREGYDDVRTWGDHLRAEKQIFAQYRWTAWMMLCCEVILSWKFRHNAGNRLDESVHWYVVLPWATYIIGSLLYYCYLRLFYKYRIYKDGTYMDLEIRQQSLQNKKTN